MALTDASPIIPGVAVVAVTEGMERSEWLDLRRRGIGGSDAAAICGQSRYKSAFELWLEKTAAPEYVDDADNEPMEWGRRLEPLVADVVAEREGMDLVPVHALLAHPDRPWQLANIDRAAYDRTGGLGVYEGKTAGHFAGADWEGDAVPDAYLLQGMHYLAVTGMPWVLYGVLIGGQRLAIRRVQRDDELIAHLTTLEADFWRRVVERTPPDPDGSKSCTELLAHMWDVKPGAVLTLDPDEVEPLLIERATHDAVEKAAAKAKAEVENRLKAALGEHEIAVGPDGRQIYTWKEHERSDLDRAALSEAHPDIVDAFTRTSTYRKFHAPTRKAS